MALSNYANCFVLWQRLQAAFLQGDKGWLGGDPLKRHPRNSPEEDSTPLFPGLRSPALPAMHQTGEANRRYLHCAPVGLGCSVRGTHRLRPSQSVRRLGEFGGWWIFIGLTLCSFHMAPSAFTSWLECLPSSKHW